MNNTIFTTDETFYSACRLLEILLSRAEEREEERKSQ